MQTHALGSHSRLTTRLASRAETITGAVFAALLGAVLLWGVGFSQISVLHNAAHDVRHSAAFPCH